MTLSNSCTPLGFASCLLRNTPPQLEMGLCAEPTGMFLPGIKIAEVDTMSLFRLNDNSVYKKSGAKHRPKHLCFCRGNIPWCQTNQSLGPLLIVWDVWEMKKNKRKKKKDKIAGSYHRSRLSHTCSHLILQGISIDPIIKTGNLDPRSVIISLNPAHLSARVGETFKPSSAISLESHLTFPGLDTCPSKAST